MKKVFSVLLVFVTLFAVTAPLALADAAGNVVPYAVNKTKAGVMTLGDKLDEPVEMEKDGEVILVIPDAEDGAVYDWKLREDLYIVSFRVVEYNSKGQIVIVQEDKPSDLHRTTGSQMVMIVGMAPGNNFVDVTIVENLDNDDPVEYLPVGDVQINVKQPEDPDRGDVTQNDLCTILKIWWTDLQWTWYYQIHPALKFAYFTVIDWISATFNMIVTTVRGWFA